MFKNIFDHISYLKYNNNFKIGSLIYWQKRKKKRTSISKKKNEFIKISEKEKRILENIEFFFSLANSLSTGNSKTFLCNK